MQLLKLVHRKLPTRYELSKSNPHVQSTCPHCLETETFTHIMHCHNPKARQFRESIQAKVEKYLITTGTPDLFRQTLLACIPLWFATDPPLDSPTLSDCHPWYNEQKLIGWDLFLSGILTKSWRSAYYKSPQSLQRSRDYTTLMSGLVQLLWSEQLQFWTEYVATVYHQSSTSTHTTSHQSQYFYNDVNEFLDNATIPQMRAYLTSYEHAIRASILSAKSHRSRTLFQFPRFPLRRIPPAPGTRPRQLQPANMTTRPDQRARGEIIPRKHTRWRLAPPSLQSIRTFFRPPPPT